MSTKTIEEIKKELEDFCRDRNIQLSVELYDGLQIWDLQEGDNPVYCNGFEDKRKVKP